MGTKDTQLIPGVAPETFILNQPVGTEKPGQTKTTVTFLVKAATTETGGSRPPQNVTVGPEPHNGNESLCCQV